MQVDILLYIFIGIMAAVAVRVLFTIIEFVFRLIAAVMKLTIAAAIIVGIIYYFPSIISFFNNLN
jgi:hypothetical protein